VISEVELFEHANRCLEFLREYNQDNSQVGGFLGARYLIKFPNSLVLSYISEEEVYLYSSDNSLELNLPDEQWKYVKGAGSWLSKEVFTPEYLYEVVSGFTGHYGKAILIFPWTEWIEVGPLSDDWAELIEELDSEELEEFKKSQDSQRVIEEISHSDPKSFIFDVDHLFEGDEALIPNGSQYSRYRRFCQELENLGWIIIDYMNDQGFAYDALEEEREGSDFDGVPPALISPLESVFQAYSPNGELDDWFAIIDLGDGNLEDLKLAEKCGLKVEIRHENMLTILKD